MFKPSSTSSPCGGAGGVGGSGGEKKPNRFLLQLKKEEEAKR
jgi:hypothetical protein